MNGTHRDFDSRAATWDLDASKWERARHVAEAIRAAFPDLGVRRVLEYGSGTGLLGLALQPFVAEIVLADSSPEMLRIADGKIVSNGIGNAATLLLDLERDSLPQARFDLVCALMTLHHVADTDAILRAFHAGLNDGGAVCIADLDREDGSFHGEGFSGHNGFDRSDLLARMERCGFRDVHFSTVHHVEKATASGTRRYPVFLAVAVKA